MQTKHTAQSGLFALRSLLVLSFCTVGVCSVITGTLFAFWRPDAPVQASQRALTFAERVAYQRAIEDVYWRHRIWPKERTDRKPSLEGVMSQAQIESKVQDYLRKSQALEDYWQRPITTEQLQAEMDRMAKHTKQPDVLRELFQALGNDPFAIAECLARPVLIERLPAHLAFEQVKETSRTFSQIETATARYALPTISGPTGGCTDDTWTATNLVNATARATHTAVWTGSEMIVWGGVECSPNCSYLNTGGRYNPSTDSWTATSTTDTPEARSGHTAVWTGSEMIVWGGYGAGTYFHTGGRYNPSTDSWTPTSTTNWPIGRRFHTAVWTGSEMIVWGGQDANLNDLNTGGRYNPGTDSWTATSITNAPAPRDSHQTVWTGSEMIVWGGGYTTGGRYNPSADTWVATSTTNAPTARADNTAVWTGSEMIVWGGQGVLEGYLNTGGKYNPSTDSWTATSTTNAPDARSVHTAVWTGREMIVWGGRNCSPNCINFNTGDRYNPDTDGWVATSTTNAPTAREDHTAVWTGSEMIAWGGFYRDVHGFHFVNSGGRYCAQSGPTPTPTATPTTTPTATPTSTPRPSPTPRPALTPRPRPTPAPRP
jgi:N-acetylneuraminic acid mutarotase